MTQVFYDIGDLIVTPGNTYRVERILGAGGMGTVSVARDKMLGSLCVIKILHPELTSSSVRLRFEHEARVIAQIVHPNIVRVTRLGTLEDDAKTPFYVMEHLVGESLRAALSKRKNDRGAGFRIDQALNIAAQIFYGLEAVHERGVIHRDMKPENVILHVDARANRVAKIIDFGVMRILAEGGRESFAGTFGYAAPEQIRGEEIGPKVDLFATGLMLFEMLTGRRPYEQYGSGEAGAVARLDIAVPSLDTYGEFPPALVKLLARVLALKPEDRPADAFEVASTLEKLSSALVPLDIHDVVTDQAHDQGVVDAALATAVPITSADLAAPTDPDADLPVWMRQLRMRAKQAEVLGYEPTEAQRAAMDGNDTQPGAPPFLVNDTMPMVAPRGPTLRLPGRPAPPSVAEMVTTPPSGKVQVPEKAANVLYVDSIAPTRSPAPARTNNTKSPSPPPASVAQRREPESRERRPTPAAASPGRSSGRRRVVAPMALWKRQLLVFGIFLVCVTTVGVVVIAIRRPNLLVPRSPTTTGKLPASGGGP